MRHLSALLLLSLCLLLLQTSHANPPVVLPYTPDYDGDYDMFGGESYMTGDDNLMLFSMTSSHGMSLLKKTQTAVTNLKRLTDPLLLATQMAIFFSSAVSLPKKGCISFFKHGCYSAQAIEN